jgi:eukaryotic-like serine/threonine-protein kinase
MHCMSFPPEARGLLEAALAQHRAALAKVPSHPIYRGEAHTASESLGRILDRLGDHADLASRAAQLSPNPSGDAIRDRLAPCLLPRGIPLALADGSVAPVVRREHARGFADHAMVALAEASRKGDHDIRRYRSDPDLALLRVRDDFNHLMMDLAFPADPFAR